MSNITIYGIDISAIVIILLVLILGKKIIGKILKIIIVVGTILFLIYINFLR